MCPAVPTVSGIPSDANHRLAISAVAGVWHQHRGRDPSLRAASLQMVSFVGGWATGWCQTRDGFERDTVASAIAPRSRDVVRCPLRRHIGGQSQPHVGDNMTLKLKWWAAAAVACAAVTAFALPAAADVVPATSGSLTMTSDPGDYIGGGQSWSYAMPPDSFASQILYRNGVEVIVNGANGDWWYLDFGAPNGAQLTPGTYDNAARWPFQDPSQPGLSIFGNGRGCNTLTGRFTVLDATYAPGGSLVSFHATFEQHCEGFAAALRGEVQLTSEPPLQITLTLDPKGSIRSTTSTVHGTITCSRAATVFVSGTISQQTKRYGTTTGPFGATVDCTTTATAWSATGSSSSGAPFVPGTASVDASATGTEPPSDTAHTSSTVQLSSSK